MTDAPRRRPGRQGTTRKEREKLPTCGATTREGKACGRPAGWGTSHPGEGRCKLHGGIGQISGTRYEQLETAPRLGELIDRFAADTNPHDLSHELHLLRALVADYVERYEATTSALLAWHASFDRGFQEALGEWRGEVAAYLEYMEKYGAEPDRPFPQPPQPEEFVHKPRQMVDITAVAGLVDRIGSMSDRIQKRQEIGSISMARLSQVLEELAIELVNACEEVGINDNDRTRLLTAVDRRWRDARSIPRSALMAPDGVQEGARQLN